MSVITLPEGLYVSRMTWSQQRMGVQFRSMFGSQAVEGSPPVWAVSIEIDRMKESRAGAWKALLLQLQGSTNQLAVWDVARPQPRGTLRGALTFGAAAKQGDTTITIHAGVEGAGKTLLAGDWIGFGSGLTQQVVMNMQDVVIDPARYSLSLDFAAQVYAAGIPGEFKMTVQPPVRNDMPAGAAITWDKPKALFRVQNPRLGWDYETTFASGFALELLEDTRP